jgi:putative PIN family toxin of toxin-antitoxin system
VIRAVLDANVLVSGLLSPKGPPGQILDAWLAGEFQICITPQILDEVSRVLQYPRIQKHLMAGQTTSILEKLVGAAEWVEGTLELKVLKRDPSDNAYLACAVEAEACYLVTGDRDTFDEIGEEFRGVFILTPRAFLEVLGDDLTRS